MFAILTESVYLDVYITEMESINPLPYTAIHLQQL